MCELHLDFSNYGASKGAIWDKEKSTLHLPEAGGFRVDIREFREAQKAIEDRQGLDWEKRMPADKARAAENASLEARSKDRAQLSKQQQQELDADMRKFKKEEDLYKHANDKQAKANNAELDALIEKYKGVRWIHRMTDLKPLLDRESFNKHYKKGSLGFERVEFPKLLEGGGLAYMEAFFYDPVENNNGEMVVCHPEGRAPFGCFISASGKTKPRIVGAEWKDIEGHNIKEKVAYGSTVYLHIYTEALYGKDLKIQLRIEKEYFRRFRPIHRRKFDR